MTISHDKTTIYLFYSRTPGEDSRMKPLRSRIDILNARIHQTLYRQAEKGIQDASHPVVPITESGRVGDNSAERFSYAIEQVFDEGYQHVIDVGGLHYRQYAYNYIVSQ